VGSCWTADTLCADCSPDNYGVLDFRPDAVYTAPADTTHAPTDGSCQCEDLVAGMVSQEDFAALQATVQELQSNIGAIEMDNNDIMDGMTDMATCMSGLTDRFGDRDDETSDSPHTRPDTTAATSMMPETTTSTTKTPTILPSSAPSARWMTLGKMMDGPYNKCSTSRTDRSFKLGFTNLYNCLNRCEADASCVYATTEGSQFCIGCIVLNQYSDGWSAYQMHSHGDRRQLSELEQLRAENAALRAELARRN